MLNYFVRTEEYALRRGDQSSYAYYYNRNKTPNPLDYMAGIYSPVETSLATQNYLYHLFIACGAETSLPPFLSHNQASYDQNFRRSLVELTQVNADQAKTSLEIFTKKLEEPKFAAPENPKKWEEYRLWMVGQVLITRNSPEAKRNNKKTQNSTAVQNKWRLAYYEQATSLLKETNAKGWADLYPDLPRDTKKIGSDTSGIDRPSKRTQYEILRSGWGTDMCLPHLLEPYDELFEACWAGDNAKIQELCLPSTKKGGKSERAPLQISVQCSEVSDPKQPLMMSGDGVHTPLSIAVIARKWDTARLVMTIADAQWKRPEKESANASKKFRAAIDLSE